MGRGREGGRKRECVICSNNQQISRREGVKGMREGGMGWKCVICSSNMPLCTSLHLYICLHTSPHQVECILSQTDDGTVVLVSPTLFVPPPS